MKIKLPNKYKFCIALLRYPFWRGAHEVFQKMSVDCKTAQELLRFPRIFSCRKLVRTGSDGSEALSALEDEEIAMQRAILRKLIHIAFPREASAGPPELSIQVLETSCSMANAFAFMEVTSLVGAGACKDGRLLRHFVNEVVQLLTAKENGDFLTKEEMEFIRSSPEMLRRLLGDWNCKRFLMDEMVLHTIASAPALCPTQQLVQTLLDNDIDVFLRNHRGDTPIDCARTPEMVRVMEDAEIECFLKPVRILLKVEKRLHLDSEIPFDVLIEIASRVTNASPVRVISISRRLYQNRLGN